MGNWRTVMIVGTCPQDQVDPLRDKLRFSVDSDGWGGLLEEAECLWVSAGLCGLGEWPEARMNVGGNLFERDYGVDDVRRALDACAAAAPGLDVKVHCGDDWESSKCIATVTKQPGSAAVVGDPEVPEVFGASEESIRLRMQSHMTGGRGY